MPLRIGVICPSEIALRRFMPALAQCSDFVFAGIAYASDDEWYGDSLATVSEDMRRQRRSSERTKAEAFLAAGGTLYDSYSALLSSAAIDAVYLPLPPALHALWGRRALEHGKHLFVEKPATTCLGDSRRLIDAASSRQLAVHENYMFVFHNQLAAINDIVASGVIGDLRLIRISFGFPRRPMPDFRYNRALGGGALLDCGGYTIRYATMLLGGGAHVVAASANSVDGFDVDMFGAATMANATGITAQLAFGMDNSYKCDLELWGSKGSLHSGRVLTAPAGFTPTARIRHGNDEEVRDLPADDTFAKSLRYFNRCITDPASRDESYQQILRQADLLREFRRLAGMEDC